MKLFIKSLSWKRWTLVNRLVLGGRGSNLDPPLTGLVTDCVFDLCFLCLKRLKILSIVELAILRMVTKTHTSTRAHTIHKSRISWLQHFYKVDCQNVVNREGSKTWFTTGDDWKWHYFSIINYTVCFFLSKFLRIRSRCRPRYLTFGQTVYTLGTVLVVGQSKLVHNILCSYFVD